MTVCGINRPRQGEILWNGMPIHELPPHEIVSMGISQVPEGRLIFPDLSVRENLDLGAFLRRDSQGVKEDMDYVFSLFPILAERRRQAGGTLSGGEQQMLAISRALMVFLVEQNANQALRVAHRGYVMENGRVVMEDTAANLLQSDEVRSAYLGV